MNRKRKISEDEMSNKEHNNNAYVCLQCSEKIILVKHEAMICQKCNFRIFKKKDYTCLVYNTTTQSYE